MPGKQVKNWAMYEALRNQGKTKESAARITNAATKKRKRRKKSVRASK
jgi:hypothetical protein